MSQNDYTEGDFIAGEFRVQRVFGGGMGKVYLVDSREHEIPFVLKTYQAIAQDSDAAIQFRKEADAWVRIGRHPNVVAAHWVRELDFRLFVAAEYIAPDEEGRNTIRSYLNGSPLPMSLVLRWAAQFCYGMQHALRKGIIVHRDVKPENLLVTATGDLKITDFGLAAASMTSFVRLPPNSGTVPPSIAATSIRGTLPYMAPEQFISEAKLDCRSDIYSFGLVLHELISGQYPYAIEDVEADPILAFARAHLKQNPKSLSSPLSPVISRCLQKDPTKRFDSYEELQNAVSMVAEELRIPLPPCPTVTDASLEDLYAMAQSQSALGKPKEALAAIECYLKQAPDVYWAWTELGRIRLAMNDDEGAMAATKRSLAIYHYNSHVWNNLGLILKRLRKPKEASEAFEKALECDPANIGAITNYALLCSDIGAHQKTANLLLVALALCPTKQTLLFNAHNCAGLMAQHGEVEAAARLLRQVVKGDPEYKLAWHNLGLCALSSKREQEAIQCFEAVLRIDGAESFARMELLKLLAKNGHSAVAELHLDELIRRGQELTKAVSMKAELMAASHRAGAAIRMLKDWMQREPANDSLAFTLAVIAEQDGQFKLALDAALRAKSLLNTESGAGQGNLQVLNGMIARLSQKTPSRSPWWKRLIGDN